MKKINLRNILIMLLSVVMAVGCFVITGCGDSSGDNTKGDIAPTESKQETLSPWEFYDENHLIGKTAAEIVEIHGALEFTVTEGGGAWFKAESGVAVAFPLDYENFVYSEPYEITDMETKCIAAGGTEEEMFGISGEATFEEIEEALGLSFGNEAGYYGYIDYFVYDGKDYCIAIEPTDGYIEGHNHTIMIFSQGD